MTHRAGFAWAHCCPGTSRIVPPWALLLCRSSQSSCHLPPEVMASGHTPGGHAAAEETARYPGAPGAGQGGWEAPARTEPGVTVELV